MARPNQAQLKRAKQRRDAHNAEMRPLLPKRRTFEETKRGAEIVMAEHDAKLAAKLGLANG